MKNVHQFLTHNIIKSINACLILILIKYHNNYGVINVELNDKVIESNCSLK